MTALLESRPTHLRIRVISRPAETAISARPRKIGSYERLKAAMDFAAAAILFVLSLPFMAIFAILIKWTSRGPVLYSQVRLGRNGLPFELHKLRTMHHECEALTGPQWSRPGDPRVTPLGRFLRRVHIDELPQLWNVLRGDMSLVGPRPERPEFAGPLEIALPGYSDRLQVKPGVTGLAQIQLPPDTNIESVRRKLALDLYYVEQIGFWLDARILLGTCLHLAGVPYRGIRRCLALPTKKVMQPVVIPIAQTGT
jgi:lipopolysaccharide/colanic/teichoic acid biosynthesis glycosyltransferase